jgi:Amt family ammonium transporter
MSSLGACIGAIVGLVAITPAAGFVTLSQSIVIGFIAAIVSNIAISVNKKSEIDDTLDVFPSHGVGGIVGMLLTSVFAKDVGLIYGEYETMLYHLIALVLVALFSFVGTYIILKIVDKLLTLRVKEYQEEKGLDLSQHGENI